MIFWVVTAAVAWTVVVLLLGVLIARGLRAADRHQEGKRSAQRTALGGDLPLAPELQRGSVETGECSQGNGASTPKAPPRSFAGPP